MSLHPILEILSLNSEWPDLYVLIDSKIPMEIDQEYVQHRLLIRDNTRYLSLSGLCFSIHDSILEIKGFVGEKIDPCLSLFNATWDKLTPFNGSIPIVNPNPETITHNNRLFYFYYLTGTLDSIISRIPAFNSKNHLSNLSLVASEPSADMFVQFLKLLPCQNIALMVNNFCTDLNSGALPIIYGMDKFESLASHFQSFLDRVETEIQSIGEFSSLSQEQINNLIDGCENHLINVGYDIFYEKLNKSEKDCLISRTISCLNLAGFSSSNLDILVQEKTIIIIGCCLLKFEAADTPIKKLEQLCTIHDEIIESLNGKDENTDSILSCLILAIVKTNPFKLYSNFLFTKCLRASKRITGQEAYVLVNIEAAIDYLLGINMEQYGVSREIAELAKPTTKKTKTTEGKKQDLVENISKLATGFSQKVINFKFPRAPFLKGGKLVNSNYFGRKISPTMKPLDRKQSRTELASQPDANLSVGQQLKEQLRKKSSKI